MAMRVLVDHSGNKGLGDIVCETGFYSALRRRYPDVRISSRHCRTLAWGNPDIDAFDESSSDSDFDLVIRTPNMKAFETPLRDSLAASRSIFEHFLRQQDLDDGRYPPRLHVLEREVAELGLEDDGQGGLAVALCADAKEFDRRWGAERFQALAQYLESQHGATVVELGSGTSEGHLDVGLDLVGKTTIRQTLAILSLCDLFVGNHGGLSHMAGGVGTPILSPWGSSHPYRAYAYDEESRALETELPCQNCRWSGAALPQCVSGDQYARTPCTQGISVEQMRVAADAMIAELTPKLGALRERKEALRRAARDPRSLERFEHRDVITQYTHDHLIVGGLPPGWAGEHSADNFARLDKIVAFTDLRPGAPAWQSVVRNYIAHARADSAWVLILAVAAMTATEARSVIQDFINLELRPAHPIPKLLAITGPMSAAQRQELCQRARICLGSSHPHSPLGSSRPAEPGSLDASVQAIDWKALLR